MEKNITRLKILFYIVFILLYISCDEKPLTVKNIPFKGYLIEGQLAGKAEKIYLFDETYKKVDSVKITKSKFSLKGKIKTPSLFYLQKSNDTIKHAIVLENKKYKTLFQNGKAIIIGGDLNTKLANYQHAKTNYDIEKANYYEQYKAKDIDLRSYLNKMDSLISIENENFKNFFLANESNLLSSFILKQQKLSSKDVVELKELVLQSSNANLLTNLNTLADNLVIEEAEKKILRRKKAPLFTGVNLKGSKSSLETLMKGKKAFLIDFWASWCPPCRDASPKLINIHRKYKNKGFDILTVSEDRSVSDWKSGVFIDDIEERWYHIYDDFNRISSMYNATALPHMVLIDENGKIIKNKISFLGLEEELTKIFNEE